MLPYLEEVVPLWLIWKLPEMCSHTRKPKRWLSKGRGRPFSPVFMAWSGWTCRAVSCPPRLSSKALPVLRSIYGGGWETSINLASELQKHKESYILLVMIWQPFFCRELLLGIACNMHIKNLHLDLSNNDLQAQGGQVLGSSIGNISSITSLDISNNSKLLQNIIFMTISLLKHVKLSALRCLEIQYLITLLHS